LPRPRPHRALHSFPTRRSSDLKALAAWHENTRCCGHCGGTTLIKDGGWRRKCWACGQDHFPRTDPVVIMLIVDPPNDRCLLGHRSEEHTSELQSRENLVCRLLL